MRGRWPSRYAVCAVVIVAAIADPAGAVTRRAFVTSSAGTGNFASWPGNYDGGLTGIAAANSICQTTAFFSSLTGVASAFLSYRAWVSVSGTDAYCNVLGLTGTVEGNCGQVGVLPQGGPWRLSNGATLFTETLDEVVNGNPKIYFPALADENFTLFTDVTDAQYWTGTGKDGIGGVANCNDWTSSLAGTNGELGTGLGTSVLWTDVRSLPCDQPRRLLCMEMGAGDPASSSWTSPGSIVFVTSDQHPAKLGNDPLAGSEVGVAAGDAICQARASAAHLPAPSSFVAWLSDSSTEPSTRITSSGPFRRIDGIAVASSKADLVDGALTTTIHQTEVGTYLDSSSTFLSGTDAFGHSNGDDCNGWTTSSGLLAGLGTAALARTADWSESPTGGVGNCASSARLVCIANTVTVFWDGFDYTGDTARWSGSSP
ncbi:MAG: hypothetical protein U0610_03220 [bacterium]